MQGEQGFNSPGQLEIPEPVFEEILVNALVRRDYFINAPIRLLIFADRVEIISPGHLPNHLDAEQICFGLSNLRNPALASHAFHLLPYRGLGIQKEPGLRAPMLAARMNTSVKNVERWLQQLKDRQTIEFRGATKTGGYYPKKKEEGSTPPS